MLLEKIWVKKPKLLEAVKDANAIIIHSDICVMLGSAGCRQGTEDCGAYRCPEYDNIDLKAATAHNGMCNEYSGTGH